MLRKSRIGLSVAAASVLAMACAAARADDTPVVVHASPSSSMVVSIRDLDLQRSGDVERLYSRLNIAADQVCGTRAFNVFYYTYPRYRACVDNAVQKAVAQIHQPGLTAFSRQQPASSREGTLLASQ